MQESWEDQVCHVHFHVVHHPELCWGYETWAKAVNEETASVMSKFLYSPHHAWLRHAFSSC